MILYNHVQASQSAHTKSTVYFCGIYSNNNNSDYYYYFFFVIIIVLRIAPIFYLMWIPLKVFLNLTPMWVEFVCSPLFSKS